MATKIKLSSFNFLNNIVDLFYHDRVFLFYFENETVSVMVNRIQVITMYMTLGKNNKQLKPLADSRDRRTEGDL